MLALAVYLVACSSALPQDDSIALLTGPPGYRYEGAGCFTNWARGRLIVDPTYGTAIVDEDVGGYTSIVAWRPGFTARRVGSEVAVFDQNGTRVAVTGGTYLIDGGYVAPGGSSGIIWPDLKIGVFWACDRVI